MHRLLFLVLTIATLSSCSKEEDVLNTAELVGKWKLIEQYWDPGDGSGDFQPINSKRTIEFFKSGKVESNGSLCSMSSDTGQNSLGNFDDKKGTIVPKTTCNSFGYKIYYQLIDGNLHLGYQCIEGCSQKFEKISN